MTLYLRHVPELIAREARAAAARQGITLRELVTDALAAKLGLAADGGPGGGEQDLAHLKADMEWYEAHKEEFLRAYADQYVAIVDRRVIDHDSDFASLARRVLERTKGRPVFMPKVVPGERTARLPSPRVLRT